MLTVYGDLLSGNCYKIKLILQLLSIPHQWQHVDVFKWRNTKCRISSQESRR